MYFFVIRIDTKREREREKISEIKSYFVIYEKRFCNLEVVYLNQQVTFWEQKETSSKSKVTYDTKLRKH